MVKWADRQELSRYNNGDHRRGPRRESLRSATSDGQSAGLSVVTNPTEITYTFGTPTTHQGHHNYPTQFRSTSGRNFAGLSFAPDPQGAYSPGTPDTHHHMPSFNNSTIAQEPSQTHPNATTTNQATDDELTEQIRVSVEDTHISRGFHANGESGGNISAVLDSYEEKSVSAYGNIVAERNCFDGSCPFDLVVHKGTQDSSPNNQRVNQFGTHISSAALPSSSSSRVGDYDEQSTQAMTASSAQHSRRLGPDTRESKQQTTRGTSTTGPSLVTDLTAYDLFDHIDASLHQEIIADIDHIRHSLKVQSSQPEPSSPRSQVEIDSQRRHHLKGASISEEPRGESGEELDRDVSIIDTLPSYANIRQIGVIKSNLFDGSSFSGHQMSEKYKYGVNVKIQHVDYDNSYICGYLCIAHLTRNHPSLTTFFEGEIISDRYSFFTGKWGATPEIDRAHWSKFSDFAKKDLSVFRRHDFDYNQLKDSDYVYMRWKERFLVPDHTIKFVDGASYDGFYYTCYSKRTSQIKGYYFHLWDDEFEKFQSLSLKFDCHERNAQVFEFR